MELMEVISGRRSHRQYNGQKVSPEAMREVLKTGLLAPSPKNRLPWYFVDCGPKTKNFILAEPKRKRAGNGALREEPGQPANQHEIN